MHHTTRCFPCVYKSQWQAGKMQNSTPLNAILRHQQSINTGHVAGLAPDQELAVAVRVHPHPDAMWRPTGVEAADILRRVQPADPDPPQPPLHTVVVCTCTWYALNNTA